jgi:hypothetical protein
MICRGGWDKHGSFPETEFPHYGIYRVDPLFPSSAALAEQCNVGCSGSQLSWVFNKGHRPTGYCWSSAGCQGKQETISHMLFSCPTAFRVWQCVLDTWVAVTILEQHDFVYIFFTTTYGVLLDVEPAWANVSIFERALTVACGYRNNVMGPSQVHPRRIAFTTFAWRWGLSSPKCGYVSATFRPAIGFPVGRHWLHLNIYIHLPQMSEKLHSPHLRFETVLSPIQSCTLT